MHTKLMLNNAEEMFIYPFTLCKPNTCPNTKACLNAVRFKHERGRQISNSYFFLEVYMYFSNL
jgi:hypothetical protein